MPGAALPGAFKQRPSNCFSAGAGNEESRGGMCLCRLTGPASATRCRLRASPGSPGCAGGTDELPRDVLDPSQARGCAFTLSIRGGGAVPTLRRSALQQAAKQSPGAAGARRRAQAYQPSSHQALLARARRGCTTSESMRPSFCVTLGSGAAGGASLPCAPFTCCRGRLSTAGFAALACSQLLVGTW